MSPEPGWWERRYRDESTPWDLNEPAPPLLEAIALLRIRPPLRVLFPGCGRGHDAIAFARRGFQVTGVDVASAALDEARALADDAGQPVDFILADYFDLPPAWNSRFDLIVEHTFLVALEPERRVAYVTTAHALLVPGGRLLGLFFPLNPIGRGGPPYAIEQSEIEPLFRNQFDLRWKHRPISSAASRAGNEIIALFQKN